MSTIYILLLLALLVFVLYATWRPGSKKLAPSEVNERAALNAARGVAQASKGADLAPLQYPTSDIPAHTGTARRR